MARTWAASLMSTGRAAQLDSSMASSERASPLREARKSRAPSLASSRAVARPMPEEAPVMRMVLPVRLMATSGEPVDSDSGQLFQSALLPGLGGASVPQGLAYQE